MPTLVCWPTRLAVVFALLVLVPGRPDPATANEPDPAYWRLDEIQAAFDTWEMAHPDIFHRTSLGFSGDGVAIPAARISDQAAEAEPEPRLLFHAAQHANEVNGTTAVMATMRRLLDGYGVDPAITARVDGLELWFVPVLNVDGHLHVYGLNPNWRDWRKTLRDNDGNGEIDFPDDGVDLNRNWDWFWSDCDDVDPASQKYRGPHPWSEKETLAVRRFVMDERPVIVVDYHSPVTISWSNTIFWPWQSTHGWGMSPDAAVASGVAHAWANHTLTESGQAYHSLFCYDSLPKEQCWIYGNTGILTFLMEISDRCWWGGAAVDSVGERVARGSMYLMDRTLTGPGISGMVADAATDAPLEAEVRLLEMHGDEVGPRLTEARFGQYHRLTEAEGYTIEVSCRGYITQTKSVLVPAGTWSRVDFALQPEATAVEPDPARRPVASWLRSANPLPRGGAVRLALPAGHPAASVELFDLRGRHIVVLGEDLAAGREHRLGLPGRLPAGVYLLRSRAGAREQVARLVVVN